MEKQCGVNRLLPMKRHSLNLPALALSLLFTVWFSSGNLHGQDGKGLTPKQLVGSFYALCKEGRAAEALKKALSASSTLKPEDGNKVAAAFAEMIQGMGSFLDYEITRETQITKRTVVIRCMAHFQKQPFMSEFTFYNPGENDWRMIHLRYDANVATMFASDLAGKAP